MLLCYWCTGIRSILFIDLISAITNEYDLLCIKTARLKSRLSADINDMFIFRVRTDSVCNLVSNYNVEHFHEQALLMYLQYVRTHVHAYTIYVVNSASLLSHWVTYKTTTLTFPNFFCAVNLCQFTMTTVCNNTRQSGHSNHSSFISCSNMYIFANTTKYVLFFYTDMRNSKETIFSGVVDFFFSRNITRVCFEETQSRNRVKITLNHRKWEALCVCIRLIMPHRLVRKVPGLYRKGRSMPLLVLPLFKHIHLCTAAINCRPVVSHWQLNYFRRHSP